MENKIPKYEISFHINDLKIREQILSFDIEKLKELRGSLRSYSNILEKRLKNRKNIDQLINGIKNHQIKIKLGR